MSKEPELFDDDGRADPEFDRFWKAWPKKSDKKRARLAFAKMSAASKKAAVADAEKRKREGWWATHPLMLALSYINGERWDDEWLEELERERRLNRQGPNTTPARQYTYKPPEEQVSIDPAERILNRVFRDYLFTYYGRYNKALPDAEKALEEKRSIMKEIVPALREDVAAGELEQSRANVEIVDTFLTRLDLAFGVNLRQAAWDAARRRSRKVA